MPENLSSVIEDAITDAELPEVDSTPVSEPAPEAPEAPVVDSTPTLEPEPSTPTVDLSKSPTDEFDKKYGLSPQAQSGRENRIPYSRVKRIADNAAKETETRVRKEFESHIPLTKFQEMETKVREYEPKVREYEDRLTKVAQFEHIMLNDTPRFIQMLSNLPQYAQIFEPLFRGAGAQTGQTQEPSLDDMPAPDRQLSDGSAVYSMDGLKALLSWQAKQVKSQVTREVEARYAPIETDYQRHQAVQAVLPRVQQQISDARRWPLFNESEAEIVKTLKDNPSFNLERAYQQVVLPKLQSSRDQMRAELLKEVKQAPRSTSAPVAQFKSTAPTSTGPRKLEDIIADSIKGIK